MAFNLLSNARIFSRTMASFTINSKARLNSGYEIPVLGFGVGQPVPDLPCLILM
jgi:hypothetical protein